MMKPSKKPENEVPDNEEQGKQNLYSFGRCLIKEAREKRFVFFATLRILHEAKGKTYKYRAPIKFKGVIINLHQIFKEVNSRGGIQKVIRNKSYTKEVCKALGYDSITDHEDLFTVYNKFMLDQYELLYITEQTPKSHPSDPHLKTVKQVLSPPKALIPLNSVPKAGDNTTAISTSLFSGKINSSGTTLPAKKRPRPGATLQQSPDFHWSDNKSSIRALQVKEVGPGATSIEIPESHFSDRRITSRRDLRSRAPQKQSQGATLQQNLDFHSSDKKSSSIRTLPVKEVRPGATSEDIQDFHFSNKRSSSINDVRSRAPQKQIQDPSPLKSIPQSIDLFFREQQMSTNRAAKRQEEQKELAGTSLDGKDEVGTNSYPGIGPKGKVSGGNCDLNGKHVGTNEWGKDLSLAKKHNDWGKELSLAARLGSSRLLSKAEQVEDEDLDVNK